MVILLTDGRLICLEDQLNEERKDYIRSITRLLSSGAPASELRELHFIVRINCQDLDFHSPPPVHNASLLQELEKVLITQPYTNPNVNILFTTTVGTKTTSMHIAAVLRDVFPTLDRYNRLHITSMSGMCYV